MGLIYIVIAQLFWATEIILIRKFFPTLNSLFLSAIGCVIGSLFYLPIIFINKVKLSLNEWIIIIVYSMTSWFLAQIFYVTGIQKGANAFSVSMATLTLPLFAVILGAIFLKEPFSLKAVLGGLLMIIGFIIISFK